MKRSLKKLTLLLLSTLLPCLSWATGATWTTVTLPEAKNARSATAMNGANDSDQLTQINVLNRGLDLSLGSVEAGLNKNTDGDTFLSVTWPVANEGYWTGDSILFTGRNYYNGVSAALVVGEEIPAGTILKGVRLKATIASGSDVARTVGYGIGVASNGATSFNEGFTATSEATGSTSQDTSTELTLSFDNYTWNGGDKIIVALCGVGVGTNQNAYTIKDISVEYLTKENYLEYVKTFPTPVVLADFGTSTEITDNTDGWVSVAATSATTNIDCGNGVIFATSGRKYGSTTDKVFTNGNFMDPFSQKGGGYSSVLKEMQTTLGLKAPVPTGVYQDGIHSGWGGSGVATVTINGLNPKQCYTLYAIGGATTTDNNPQFNLVTYDTTKTPIINYAKQDSTSYQTAEGVISLSAYDLLLVRVYNLYPNSDGIIAFKTDEENKTTTYREGFNCVALAATFPVYTRTLESATETWTEAEDAITWSPAITKPADESAAVLTATVDTTLTVDSDASLGVLSINGEDVTLSGTDVTLSAITTVVNANTDVSGITGTTSLGAVTVAEGKTLTVAAGTTIDTATVNGKIAIDAAGLEAGDVVLNCTNAAEFVANIELSNCADDLALKTTDAGLVLAPAVCSVGDNSYSSLAAALQVSGVTEITIIADTDENIASLPTTVTVTVAADVNYTGTITDAYGYLIDATENNDGTKAYTTPNTWTATTATGETYNWDATDNWSSGSVPEEGDTVYLLANGTNGDTLTMNVDDKVANVRIVGTGTFTITGSKALTVTDNIVAKTNVEVDVAAINSDDSLLMTIEDGVTATFDSGDTEIGRTMAFAGDGRFVKTGTGTFNVFAYEGKISDVDLNSLFNDVTVDVRAGTLNLTRWPLRGDTIKVNNLVATIADGATLGAPNGLTCGGATSISVASGTGTAFTAGQTVTLNGKFTKSGAGTLTVPGTVTSANEVYLDEGTLKFTAAPNLTGNTHSDSGTTLEFTNGGKITNDANAFNGLLKVSGGTVTHNGANRGLNSIEVAKGATLISSAADGLNYNGTTTATINGTLHLKNRWTIFAANTFYVSGTLASDDNNFGDHYGAYDFYNHASDDNNHAKLYVTGPNAQITGRWGAHDSSKTLDVVFDTDDAKLTITKAPSANQHVTTMLDDRVTSGAIAINTSVTTTKTLTIASGVALSGTGSWGGPVILADGAIIDATANAVAIGGAVTQSGALTIKVASTATADTTVLTCAASTFTPANISLVDAEGNAIEGLTVATNAEGTALKLISTNFKVADATTIANAVATLNTAQVDGTITLTTEIADLAETLVIDVGEGNTVTLDLAGKMLAAGDGLDSSASMIRIQSGTLLLKNSGEANSLMSTTLTGILVGADAEGNAVAEACALNIGTDVTVSAPYGTSVYVASGTVSGSGIIWGSLRLLSGATIDASAGTISTTTASLPTTDALTVKLAELPEGENATEVLTLSYGGTASDEPVVETLKVVVGEVTYIEGYKLVATADGYAVKTAETLPARKLTWMPIGDSITEGESTEVSYRHELWEMLSEQGYEIQSVGVRNGTHDGTLTEEAWSYHNAFYGARINTGASTRQRLSLDEELEVCGYPDIITILLGANDVSDYAANTASDAAVVTALVERWVEYVDRVATLRPNSQIFVGTVMNFKSNHSKAATVETFNTRIRALKESGASPFDHANVTLVELNKNENGETGLLADSDFVDLVHPNATGCIKVATRFYNAILSKLPKSDATGAAVPEMAFNDSTTAVKVLFDRPLDATAVDSITATLTGAGETTLSAPTLSEDGRTLTLTASAALPVLTNVTVTMDNVVAANATEADDVDVTFTVLGTGAEQNVPADVRNGFKRYAKKNIDATDRYSGSVTYDEKAEITDYARVAYYMELKREGKPAQFVWVAMDAFTNDINAIGIPTSATGLHQQVVTGLTMYANRGNFLEKNVTSPGTGFIEFTPGTYDRTASGITGAPTDVSALDWNDTLSSTGRYGCMQVSRILADGAYAPAEMVFAFNRFNHNSTSEVEIGIGSFSGHLKNDGTNLSSNSIDRTFLTDAEWNGLMASDYTVRTLEIWVTEPVTTTWKGEADAAWETADNWTNGMPVAGVEAIIPANSSITVAGDIAAKSITITGTDAVTLTGTATATIAETVVTKNQTLTLSGLTLTGAVTGAGTLSVDKLPTATGLNDSTLWQGTVELKSIEKTNLDLRLYGCAGSSITLNGVTGYWTYDNATSWSAITIPANICITGTNTNNNGYSDQRYILTGKITGSGTLQHTTAGGGIYQVKGDISEFTGTLSAAASGQFILGETNSTAAGKILIAGTQAINCTLTAVNGIVIESTAVVSGEGKLNSATTIASGATIDASTTQLTATADVTFPADGSITVKVATGTETFPATIIARSGLVTEQENIIGGVSLIVGEAAATGNYKLVKTTTGYAVAAAADSDPECTVNGTTNYATLADALTALSTTGGTIRMNKSVTLTETIVVDVGDTNTLTIDLAGACISSTAAPAVLVKTGTLQLTTSNPTAVGLGANYIWAKGTGSDNTTLNTAIVVGDGTSVAPALVIGANTGVTSFADTTVDLVKGTISGSGEIGKNLKLANNVTIDASTTILTIDGVVEFPGKVSDNTDGYVNSNVFFRLPEDTVYPHVVMNCEDAKATDAPETTLYVNGFFSHNYGLIEMYDNATGLVSGYGLKQYVCESADGVPYATINEALRAGETEITLLENTTENVTIGDGIVLHLGFQGVGYTVNGSVTVKDGAILFPARGAIANNLILESGATLDLAEEFENNVDFNVGGTVSFPTGGDLTIVVGSSATTVDLGEPRQIIASGTQLTPGTEWVASQFSSLKVVLDNQGTTNENTKIVTTSYTYELVNVADGPCTLDGIDYASIPQALGALATAFDDVITLNQDIKLADTVENDAVTKDGTIVINVGAENTAVIDLNGHNLTSTADPAIRIQSGTLLLINSSETAATVSTSTATAILVGASDDTGTAVAADAGCILDIGANVTIAAETTAVKVVVGTVAGSGTLNDTLVLADGAIVDATHGTLTMADGANVAFPGTDAEKGTITVLPPAGIAYPVQFIACPVAVATNYANTNLLIKMGETLSEAGNFALDLKKETVGSATTGYAIKTEYAALRVLKDGTVDAYYATFADAISQASSTDTVVLLADVIMTEDVTTNIYTNGYNITGESKATTYTIMGKLTLAQGTEIPRDTALVASDIFIADDATVTINGSIASEKDILCSGMLEGMGTIEGTLVLADGAVIGGSSMLAPTGGTIIDGKATVTIDGYLSGSLLAPNATIEGSGSIFIQEGDTLTGAGNIYPTVTLDDGATIDKIEHENAHLILHNFTQLAEEDRINITIGALGHIINTKMVALSATNFVVTLGETSGYTLYTNQTEGDTVAVPVVAVNNGDYTLGVVKLNFVLGGADLGASIGTQLAAYGYRYGILAVKGVYSDSDPVAGFQLFNNVVNGFIGDYLVITYDFGVTGTTIIAKTTTTGTGEAAVTTVTKYVLVTADVDGVYDSNTSDTRGHADYRDTTTVELCTVAENETLTPIDGATEITVGDDGNAADYGLTITEIPVGVKYFVVPYDTLFPAPAEGETPPPSETIKLKVKASASLSE